MVNTLHCKRKRNYGGTIRAGLENTKISGKYNAIMLLNYFVAPLS